MAVPKNIKRRAGHRAWLREMTDQTHPIYASTSNFSRASFQGTFFGSWKQKLSKIEKYKVSIVGNNLIYNDMICGKIK